MAMKAQNAMEFVFTYSIAITIITVAIAFVIIFANAGRSLVPAQCSFFGGFTCSFVSYTSNTGSNSVASQLMLIATDTQPGIVNVSSFNALIGSAASTSGQCTPNVATAGQSIYCTADFSSAIVPGTLYTGSFNISANYCPQGTQLYSYSCAASSNYSYKGNMQVQASSLQIGANTIAVYLPLTITNNQIVQSAPGLQVPISFQSSSYAAHGSGNLGNIRFYDGARELYSWCESGCSNTSSNTIFFVKLDRSIPADSAINLQVYFLPMSVNYDGVHAGEAPQLSPAYAEYDNGANVFNNYWNFAGTSLPTGWTSAGSYDGSVNDGLTLTSSSGWGGVASGAITATPPIILDAYETVTTEQAAMIGFSTSTSFSTYPYYNSYQYYQADSSSYTSAYIQTGTSSAQTTIASGTLPTASDSGYNVYSAVFTHSGVAQLQNYASVVSGSSTFISSASYVFAAAYSPATQKIQWLRTRDYPPNGVEPSASFGSLADVP